MPRASRIAALIIAGLLLHASPAVLARNDHNQNDRFARRDLSPSLMAPGLRDAREDRHGLSPDQAALEIQSRHGGRVLAVQPDGAGYRVKTLKDGEVRIYQVDP